MTRSAGLIAFCRYPEVRVFLAHPGGPYWKNKDDGWWTFPKGEVQGDEDDLNAAIREFEEETSLRPQGTFVRLNPVRMKSGKVVQAFAMETSQLFEAGESYQFEIEWPPKSGKIARFPEVDRCQWFTIPEARIKLLPSLLPLLDDLLQQTQAIDNE